MAVYLLNQSIISTSKLKALKLLTPKEARPRGLARFGL